MNVVVNFARTRLAVARRISESFLLTFQLELERVLNDKLIFILIGIKFPLRMKLTYLIKLL